MSVIGFDIGNESCVIAAARRGGVDVLLNDESKNETPVVVSFGEKQRFFGSAGAAFATANPKSTVSQIKRLIGKLYKEVEEDLKLLPFATSEGPRGGILIELEYLKRKWAFTPVEILGMLFKHLKQITEKNVESVVVDCVIGIPSYFTDLQRRMYLDAALIAGLRPLRLMHDGTAIALGYGMYKQADFSKSGPTNVMFIDIGHCDTQVTVAAFEPWKMKILSHSFDQNLGGKDFDEVLFHHLAAEIKKAYKIDVYANARASIRLRASCEKVKKVLSADTHAPLTIDCLMGDTDVRGFVTRKEFENLSSKLLERIIVPCNMALKDAGLSVDKIDTIELVGSASHIPAITRILRKFFKKEPARTLNARECVARGCALRCAMLSPSLIVRDYKIEDSFPYSIEIPSPKGEFMLFPKGSSFPKVTKMELQCNTPFCLPVTYITERDFPAGISHIAGSFEISLSEPSDAEKVDVEFRVKLNNHGIVEIDSAKILEDNNHFARNLYARILIDNSRVLNLSISENLEYASTNEELREAKEKEKKLVQQDIKVEEAQRNTFESFVYDTRSKPSGAYQSYVTDSQKEVTTNNLQKTKDLLYEDNDKESEQDYTQRLNDHKKEVRELQSQVTHMETQLENERRAREAMQEQIREQMKEVMQQQKAEFKRQFDKYTDASATNDELREAKGKEKMLAEQHIKVEETKDQRNTLLYIIYDTRKKLSGAYRRYATDSEKELITNNLQKTEDWLYDDNDDESSEQDYTGKLKDIKKLLEPVENRYKEENAIEKAIKSLQSCIAKYYSHADSLPDDKKEKVKNVCREAEHWLINAISQKHSSSKTLSSDVDRAIYFLESNCESIIRSEPSFPRNEKHVDSKSAREEAAKPLQTCIKKYKLLAELLPVEKKEEVNSLCREAERWHVMAVSQERLSLKTLSPKVNQVIDIVESKCQSIISVKSSFPSDEEPVGSDQMDQTVESDQNDQSLDSNNARTVATKALQAHIAKYRSRAESLPVDMKEKVKVECMTAEQWLSSLSRSYSSPNTLATYINRFIEGFESNCEGIIRSKPSSSTGR
ncbi:hypothetical protein SSX86_015568 [Deinandra increscens subsp. villosa]|uniref:Heat shock protein 70 n=1 Tax=Deinandra increscens subsp. villosa TaxID=3103831 RepID=A0AAP0D0N3_9ASTR